jgi:hypothetical protein
MAGHFLERGEYPLVGDVARAQLFRHHAPPLGSEAVLHAPII